MTQTFKNIILLLLLAAVFFVAVLANKMLLQGIKLDLSEQQVYSLSDGSEKIASSLEEPVTLYFFFSNKASKGMTSIRDYAARVEALLREYERLSDGKITLKIIDPEPFSENEDRAASFGLTAASAGINQDNIYFGLAGTNSLDDAVIIGFFDPQKERFLEYDISSLIHKLSTPDPIRLTIVSDLQLAGGQNPLTGQISPANVLYQQLQELFEIELLSASSETLPNDTDVLMLWHPQNINTELLNDIDTYIINEGKTLALVDPHFESDPMAQMGSVGANPSMLPLLDSYGISFSSEQVVLDALTGLEIRTSQTEVARHMGFLGLSREQINSQDITTGDLEVINGASFGFLTLQDASQLTEDILLRSSANSGVLANSSYASTVDISQFSSDFTNTDFAYTLAARYRGEVESHFPLHNAELANPSRFEDAANESSAEETLQEDRQADENDQSSPAPKSKSTGRINMVVIGDADIAADRFWVQQSSFFGQTVFSPFANNGDFIINILENLGGSEDLIGIRSRGTFARPFTRVEAIRTKAEEKFREQEKRLQAQLEQTEQQLAQLQGQNDELILTSEQEAAIEEFTEQKIAIRKSLREVQFELDSEINRLGVQLKLINIAGAPIALVLLLLLFAKLLRTKAPKVVKTPSSHGKKKIKRTRSEPSLYIDVSNYKEDKEK